MKRPLKALLIAVIILVALPVVAWTATFLYWHFTITTAIRELEERPRPTGLDGGPHPSVYPLVKAGGRSVPYLFGTLKRSRDEIALETAKDVIEWHAGFFGGDRSTSNLFTLCKFEPGDAPETRVRNHER